ncbi:3-deoxy-7-phosphoheptulonate synthase [Streptosporangium becharense]|uniref:Phospho-2-dehydro-3-deoxyheptonate aldolase n=1 Tax=Streptosporangium becharense TaxID=1816182 RepID=A0A7W9MI69_9ACTN|nr:3-deoxy-7-phosphoheptulonate synthase [Streptosporangium becharense]MBB2911050.1 3-deoxy-7-phosphoheptulonate synthase [Streptosporangium becharense]MBB5821892.1 3-deoxy-7-phosphoheptulonate synthase [Streptosporangium becharense]
MTHSVLDVQQAEALQQPEWSDPSQVRLVREILGSRPPLVGADDVDALRSLLARVAAGEAHVVQAGDCAESPQECTPQHVRRKSAVLHLLAATLKTATHGPVLRVGRMAGQFAKPRSNPTERVGDLTLPAYRGHMVNSPDPDPESRRPDPLRILTAYMAASDIVKHLGWHAPTPRVWPDVEPLVWTSHEALLLDYEIPMIRECGDGRRWLASTHWPWIGERTRRLDGAHVELLAGLANPVACKVGPAMGTDEITALCERLDPLREPGRLTLIARMGAGAVGDRLPSLVARVRAAGHPVIWLCDPMHGNTVVAPDGRKTRLVDTMTREVHGFRDAVAAGGGVAGGLHLETTPDPVTECVADASALGLVGDRHTTLCDPRLTARQAISLVAAWSRPGPRGPAR